MSYKAPKVVLVGAGAVGTSFLYSAVNQGIAAEYVIIDLFEDVAKGHALDIEDGIPHVELNSTVKQGGYEECANADVVVITAGRPQKEGETRLQLIQDNAKIMKAIIESINATGFNGSIVIASNPCDVLTQVAQEVSNLPANKIMSTGTNLDSGRLAKNISKIFEVAPQSVSTLIVGEHGDSSLPVWSHATVGNKRLLDFVAEGKVTEAQLEEAFVAARDAAYEIISLKRATYYGIGMSTAKIVRVILRDEKKVLPLGVRLSGEYGLNDVVIPVPALIGANGVERIDALNLSEDELAKLQSSATTLKEMFSGIEL